MGYILSTYAVPHAQLIAIPGSRDLAMLAHVLADAKEYIAEVDAQRHDGYDPTRDAPIFSVAEAIRDIFTGEWRCATDRSVYGEAEETLCCYLGERLDGVPFAASSGRWLDGLDAWLASEGVSLRLSDLIYRDPIPLPRTATDGLKVGHWTPQEIRTAAPAVDRVLLGHKEDDCDGYAEILRDIKEWLDKALARPGLCLVGVYG